MRRHTGFLLTTLLCMSGTGLLGQTPAQEAPKEDAFLADANETFMALEGAARSGLLFPHAGSLGGQTEAADRARIENLISGYHLSTQERWQPPPAWGGRWVGHNATGWVLLRIVSPDLSANNRNRAEVTFAPDIEQPIPQALLSHLLANAESTEISSGNTLDLKFAWEKPLPLATCTSQTKLRIRLATGGLVSNSMTTYCDVPKN
jgi:hypothetical protein